jgi:hypothetical protein
MQGIMTSGVSLPAMPTFIVLHPISHTIVSLEGSILWKTFRAVVLLLYEFVAEIFEVRVSIQESRGQHPRQIISGFSFVWLEKDGWKTLSKPLVFKIM